MVAYTKSQQRKKRKQRLRGEKDQIKFIDLRFNCQISLLQNFISFSFHFISRVALQQS